MIQMKETRFQYKDENKLKHINNNHELDLRFHKVINPIMFLKKAYLQESFLIFSPHVKFKAFPPPPQKK